MLLLRAQAQRERPEALAVAGALRVSAVGLTMAATVVPAGIPAPVMGMPTVTPVVVATAKLVLPVVVTPEVRPMLLPCPPSMLAMKSFVGLVPLICQREAFVVPEVLPRERPRTLPVEKLLRKNPVARNCWGVSPATSIVR